MSPLLCCPDLANGEILRNSEGADRADLLEAQLQATLNMIPAHTWYAASSGALTFVNERCADYLVRRFKIQHRSLQRRLLKKSDLSDEAIDDTFVSAHRYH
jgi:hypothetical protein